MTYFMVVLPLGVGGRDGPVTPMTGDPRRSRHFVGKYFVTGAVSCLLAQATRGTAEAKPQVRGLFHRARREHPTYGEDSSDERGKT